MTITLYEESLKSHDWWHEYSDSQEVYLKVREELVRLRRFQKLYDEDFTLWNYYAPEEFKKYLK